MIFESQMEPVRPEQVMVSLAKGAIATYGQLQEVVFLKVNRDSLLVFSDGTVLPILYEKAGYHIDIQKESYAYQVARELGGADPFSYLAFGYSGTGPNCYSAFLWAAGFKDTNVEHVVPPLKLRRDGSKVGGIQRDESIVWEDRSETPSEQIIEVEADSLEEAREQLKSQIPEGFHSLSERVIWDGKPKTLRAESDTIEAAFAKPEVPNNAQILEKKILTAPEQEIITVEAKDEQKAQINAIRRGTLGPSESVKSIRLLTLGRKGFLGIGKNPNQYEVQLFRPAVVEVTYKTKASISAKIGRRY